MVELSQEDLLELKKMGYTDAQIQEALNSAEDESPRYDPNQQRHYTTFQNNPSDNLVKYQLEVTDILERAEHVLREDIVTIVNGKLEWVNCKDSTKRIFSDYGVQEILRNLSMYVNRNTILGDYQPDEIQSKVFDFGSELNNLIFSKYEEFGLTDSEKRKNYPILVRQMVDIVHSAYSRAKYGKERDSLRTARQIAQTEQIMPPNVNIHTGEAKQERGVLNPIRYIGGKYK